MFKVQTRKDKGKHQKNPEVAGCLSYAQEGIEVSGVTQPGKLEENGVRLEGETDHQLGNPHPAKLSIKSERSEDLPKASKSSKEDGNRGVWRWW